MCVHFVHVMQRDRLSWGRGKQIDHMALPYAVHYVVNNYWVWQKAGILIVDKGCEELDPF